jgi:hypothetical protein
MPGETNLNALLKTMQPTLNDGQFVFCCVASAQTIDHSNIIGSFKEKEGLTLILNRIDADKLKLPYSFVAAWITLTVHSSLEAVGLTAAFSSALATENISCNVIAGYYHDHIFVAEKDAETAIQVLTKLSGI